MKTLIEDFAGDLKDRAYMSSLMFIYPGSTFHFQHDEKTGELVNTLVIVNGLKHGSKFRNSLLYDGQWAGWHREVIKRFRDDFPGVYEKDGYDGLWDAVCSLRDGTIEYFCYSKMGVPKWLESWFVERKKIEDRKTEAKNLSRRNDKK